MRISPVMMTPQRSNLSTQKNQNNPSFGYIESANRSKIIKKLNLTKSQVKLLDECKGVTVKKGSKTGPKGKYYADLNLGYIKHSAGKKWYKSMQARRSEDCCLNFLENRDHLCTSLERIELAMKAEDIRAAKEKIKKEKYDALPTLTPEEERQQWLEWEIYTH